MMLLELPVVMRPRTCVCLALLLLAAGCQSAGSSPAAPQPADHPITEDQAIPIDVSGERVEQINEALLLYVRIHQGIPAQLSDLQTVPSLGQQLVLVAPNGQPYIYVPNGLSIPNGNKLMIVYDPAEEADGRRWCILVSDLRPGGALTTEVMELPEPIFRAYLASAP